MTMTSLKLNDHSPLLHFPYALTVFVVCFLPPSHLRPHRWLVTARWGLHPQRLVRALPTFFPPMPVPHLGGSCRGRKSLPPAWPHTVL